jgi:hypothetical protein
MKLVALLLIGLLAGCSSREFASPTRPIVKYSCSSDAGPDVDVSVQLNPVPHRSELRRVALETLERFPHGFSPDLVSGHNIEKIIISTGEKTATYKVYASEETKSRNTRPAEVELFQALKRELIGFVSDYASVRTEINSLP